MRQIVQTEFLPFVKCFEGACSWMYLDDLGLVTTGIGNLIDPIGTATGLRWRHVTPGGGLGDLASPQDVVAEWDRIKAMQSWKMRGGGAFRAIATLGLAPEDVAALCASKMAGMWAILCKRIDHLEDAPACAQLAILSMAWAMGPDFYFPHFIAAASDGAWGSAASECKISNGAALRNKADFALFTIASHDGEGGEDDFLPTSGAGWWAWTQSL